MMPLGIAPCSWGIEDIENKNNPTWEKVISDASMTGYTGIELGPYGFFPTDASKLKGILNSNNLELTAGTLYDNLTQTADIKYLVDKTRKICSLVSKVKPDNSFLVIIDSVKSQRNLTAGHPNIAKRLEISQWKALVTNIQLISKIARDEFGIRPVIHPHAGGYIEFKDETEQIVNDIDISLAGLCLDTGHMYYAGDNPAESIKYFQSRIDYIHIKDINRKVYLNSLKNNIGFFDSCNNNVMCSIGDGCLNYNEIFNALYDINYQNWITIEQERNPKNINNVIDDLNKSFNFLDNIINKYN